jgi:hypothetical protein
MTRAACSEPVACAHGGNADVSVAIGYFDRGVNQPAFVSQRGAEVEPARGITPETYLLQRGRVVQQRGQGRLHHGDHPAVAGPVEGPRRSLIVAEKTPLNTIYRFGQRSSAPFSLGTASAHEGLT